jgi:nitrogen fixation-related uncharacterized protein
VKRKQLIGIGLVLAAVALLWFAWPAQSSPYDTGSRVRFGTEGIVADDSNAIRHATDYVLAGVYWVTIPVASSILSDPNVGGPSLWPADLVQVGLVMETTDANVRWAMNATATSTSALWPHAGYSNMPITMKDANSLRFVSMDPLARGTLFTYKPR